MFEKKATMDDLIRVERQLNGRINNIMNTFSRVTREIVESELSLLNQNSNSNEEFDLAKDLDQIQELIQSICEKYNILIDTKSGFVARTLDGGLKGLHVSVTVRKSCI